MFIGRAKYLVFTSWEMLLSLDFINQFHENDQETRIQYSNLSAKKSTISNWKKKYRLCSEIIPPKIVLLFLLAIFRRKFRASLRKKFAEKVCYSSIKDLQISPGSQEPRNWKKRAVFALTVQVTFDWFNTDDTQNSTVANVKCAIGFYRICVCVDPWWKESFSNRRHSYQVFVCVCVTRNGSLVERLCTISNTMWIWWVQNTRLQRARTHAHTIQIHYGFWLQTQ